jgi:hypothetical protein
MRSQIIGTDSGQGTTESSDWGAYGITDKDITHRYWSWSKGLRTPSVYAVGLPDGQEKKMVPVWLRFLFLRRHH